MSVLILGAGSFGLKDDHKPLDVRRDVVSISEIRPQNFSGELQKRKLKKERLRLGPRLKLKKLKPRLTRHLLSFSATRLSTPTQAKVVGWKLAKTHHWLGKEWQCLVKLWDGESGWDVTADNPSSDAYGIPQASPGEKMATKGHDWRWNPRTQIRWGLRYIKDRYLTPCRARAHSLAYNWY